MLSGKGREAPLSNADQLTIDLDAVMASALSLEPLPASVARLASLVADEGSDLRDIVEVISFDQALTGNLLRRANSASSASINSIRTVHEAVVRLGTGTVLSLAMTTSVGSRMRVAVPEYGLAERDLWAHSVRATLAAETVKRNAKVPVPSEVATAALLHDIGKLVLCRFLGPGILGLISAAKDVDHLSQLNAERLLLEVNHGELGGLVAQHWRLPDSIVSAISYHHQPDQCAQPIAYATHLSNLVAHELEETEPGDGLDRATAMRELGIDPAKWESICGTVKERYEELCARYD
ncbi:MAG: HDOD domain-containing protein [Acidimicrobiia bacterium]